jgi:hypothetical protein
MEIFDISDYNEGMKYKHHGLPLGLFLLMSACQNQVPLFTYEDDAVLCESNDATHIQDIVPIQSLTIPSGTSLTNPNNFIQTCTDEDDHPLVLAETTSINHQLVFRFDAIYPISQIVVEQKNPKMNQTQKLSVYFSTNGLTYTRVLTNANVIGEVNLLHTNGNYAKAVKFTFPAGEAFLGFSDVKFILAEGFIAEFSKTYSEYFLRTSGWTGADGIFSYDLTHGGDDIGVNHPTSGFVFSDTFVGNVNPTTQRRTSPVALINNSFGYLDNNVPLSAEAFSFDYDQEGTTPMSPVNPQAYMGHQPRNLLDSDGFVYSQTPAGLLTNQDLGISWLSETTPNALLFDFYTPQPLASMYLWNYNAFPDYGVKTMDVYAGQSLEQMGFVETITLPKATGEGFVPYTYEFTFPNGSYRYVRLEITSGYDAAKVGLGKLIFQDTNQKMLYAMIQASDTVTDQPDEVLKPRLWLQDGFVANQKLYNFPLLIKNANGFFSVNSVGMVEIPIVNERFQFEDIVYHNTPLMTRSADNGVMYFGAGVMDHRHQDGYIYVYGYKDLQGRNLLAARLTLDQLFNFNQWEFYSESGWTTNIHLAKPIKSEVSAELSVTRIAEGFYAGKYMLTVMKSTLSGSVAYAIGDTPVGPFGAYQTIYQTLEHTEFKGGFTYNAKLHPNLSTHEKMWVSYNVNTTDFPSLMDANIYYPRFISIRPIKSN